jgi:uncharacterized membrane protein YjjP (DUF1212 family)
MTGKRKHEDWMLLAAALIACLSIALMTQPDLIFWSVITGVLAICLVIIASFDWLKPWK